MKVGTRRSPRALAALLVTEEFYPRTEVDVEAQMSLSQDVSWSLPPYGIDVTALLPAAGAVAARFSAYVIQTGRPDGMWLQDAFMFNVTYWLMWLSPLVYPALPANFILQADVSLDGCSADEGWSIAVAGPPGLGVPPPVRISAGSFDVSVGGMGIPPTGYISANVPVSQRVIAPMWIAPNSQLFIAHETANTSLSGIIRLKLGGRTIQQ